jgi:MFS family permease
MQQRATGYRDFPRNVRLLIVSRFARSVGQGVTVASFALYLHTLGFDGVAIGAVLTAGLIFGAALTAIVGPLSDRNSRRTMLLLYEVASGVAALAVILTSSETVLIAAATIAGFGRGANGAAGPFAPVEQAWIAREVDGVTRRQALSFNATVGFLGMAAGAALALLPGFFSSETTLAGYRFLFAVPAIASVIAVAALALTRETRTARAGPAPSALSGDPVTRQENRQLRRLALANVLNGFGIGMIGPLMAYWFALRFGKGLSAIGPAMAVGFVLAALGSVLSGRLATRFGPVRAVLLMRGFGILCLAAMPFAPAFGVAVALYAVRSAFNRGTVGARQAVTADLTRAERRGTAASIQNLSLQIPRAIGPLLGGWLLHRGDLALPFLIAAGLQAAYLVLYGTFFGSLDRMR